MIQSQEVIILFVGILLAASLVVFTLSSQVSSGVGEASSVVRDVQSRTASSYEIVQVYENNIYVKGVSGKVPMDVVVTVNGAPQNATFVMLRDSGDVNVLEPNDLSVIVLPVPISTTDCVLIDIGGITTVWGVCR